MTLSNTLKYKFHLFGILLQGATNKKGISSLFRETKRIEAFT